MSDNLAENVEVQPEATEVAEVSESVENEATSNEEVSSEAEVQQENLSSEVSAENLEEVVDDAIEDGASVDEVKDLIKEFQLKVNGKTINKRINLADEEELKKELQLAAAGRHSMQEAAELKKLYSKEIQRLKDDPYAVLSELGLDPDELAESRIQQRIEEMKKSPEQIEREKLQKDLEVARNELKSQQEKSQKVEMDRLYEQAAVSLDEEIATALESHRSLPKSDYSVKKIADTMLWAIDNGWDDVTVEDVLPTVESELKSDINGLIDNLPEEMLEAYIGKRTTERLRQKRIKQANDSQTLSSVKQVTKKIETKEKRPKIRIEDWMRS